MLKFITQTYFFTIVLSTLLFAQSSLYMPLDIRKAYANGTRSYDGKPGENYWTNHADYTIRAELTPQSRAVDGQVSILYYNESPDSLKEIVIRLYQDFYSKTNPRDWPIHPDDINDGVTLKSIAINGRALDMKAEKPEKRFIFLGGIPVFDYLINLDLDEISLITGNKVIIIDKKILLPVLSKLLFIGENMGSGRTRNISSNLHLTLI